MFELFIGLRYLRAKQKHTFISLITLLSIAGVTVGVMALIVVIAVMSGFEADLTERILGVESHLVVLKHGGQFKDDPQLRQTIDQTPGVVASTPFVYTQAMLRASGGISGAVVRGVDPATAASVISVLDAPMLKRLSRPHADAGQREIQLPNIIIGKELARSLGVRAGESLYLISPRGMMSPAGRLPSMKRFHIADVFESGMYEYDGSLAYISLADAQKLLKNNDAITGIEVRVNDIHRADKIAKAIGKRLGFPYWARDWMQMNRNFFSALKLEKTVMFIILALIVLVAAFNIASALIMMVMEKRRAIAILKAMGASDRSIRRIFVFNGMIIGVIGTSLGACLGFLLCFLLKRYQFINLPNDVYYISTLPVKLESLDVAVIAISALAICFAATLYPAHQAARLNPVDAIRYG